VDHIQAISCGRSWVSLEIIQKYVNYSLIPLEHSEVYSHVASVWLGILDKLISSCIIINKYLCKVLQDLLCSEVTDSLENVQIMPQSDIKEIIPLEMIIYEFGKASLLYSCLNPSNLDDIIEIGRYPAILKDWAWLLVAVHQVISQIHNSLNASLILRWRSSRCYNSLLSVDYGILLSILII
jgi:hypothetical protein